MKSEDNRVTSEGKTLEITPIIYTGDGSILSLPPTIYRCPGWLLGFEPEHILGYPYTMNFSERKNIPGSNSHYGMMISFLIRIYENSPGVATGDVPEISEEWVTAFATLSETAIAQRVTALEKRNN